MLILVTRSLPLLVGQMLKWWLWIMIGIYCTLLEHSIFSTLPTITLNVVNSIPGNFIIYTHSSWIKLCVNPPSISICTRDLLSDPYNFRDLGVYSLLNALRLIFGCSWISNCMSFVAYWSVISSVSSFITTIANSFALHLWPL